MYIAENTVTDQADMDTGFRDRFINHHVNTTNLPTTQHLKVIYNDQQTNNKNNNKKEKTELSVHNQ